jgi:hypothetical protein
MLGLARLASSQDAHKATARTLIRTLGKSLRRAPKPCDKNNAKASELAARQRVLFCEKMNLDPMNIDP